MNTLESYKGTIMEEESECAQFAIDTPTSPFVLSGVTKAGEQYTFGFWIRADAEGSIKTCGKTIVATTEWVRHVITFAATSTDVRIFFETAGVYYIFHPQIEVGNIDTDYVPAPEDTDESIAAANGEIQSVREYTAQLSLNSESIKSSVSYLEGTVEGISDDLQNTKGSITSLEQTASQFKLDIQKINDDGVSKVSNTTGIFDESGMTVDNSESPTKTTVTPDGMKVYRKSGSTSEPVLSATSSGVDATNLHAKTYLIIGDRSRFENYGSNRTGCFWIGDAT